MTISGAVGSDGHEEKRLSKDIKLTNFTIPDTQSQGQSSSSNSSQNQNQSRQHLPSNIQNRPKKPVREKLKVAEDKSETKPEPQAHGSCANNLNLNSNSHQNVNVPSAPLFYWENFGGPKQMIQIQKRPNSNIDYSQESSNQVNMNSQRLQQQTTSPRKDEDADEDEEQDETKSPLRRQRQNFHDNQDKESNIRLNGLQSHYNYESSRHPPPRYHFDTSSDNNNYCYSPPSRLPWIKIAIGLGILAILLFLISISLVIVLLTRGDQKDSGENSLTEIMSGYAKPNQLIFYDDFESLNLSVWRHERFLSKDGFVIYGTNPNNSYVENSVLYIEPTLTNLEFNESFVQKGSVKMGQNFERQNGCSSFLRDECEKTARGLEYYYILNPVMSASLRTSQSFTFKYGTIEMRAQMPKGDWISTEISLMPRFNYYGEPTNTEKITLISTRGNSYYRSANQSDFGNNRICSKLIYSDTETEAIGTGTEFCKVFSDPDEPGFADSFHTFKYEWTPDFLKIFIDDKMIGKFVVVVNSFVRSSTRHVVIPGDSEHLESTRAPSFDQQFYIQLRVHVGVGFPDFGFRSKYQKPWRNDPTNNGRAPTDFWSARYTWEPTWRNRSSALQIDYIRVTSLGK